MAQKDRYGNNLRRQDRVNDLRADHKQEGVVLMTAGRGVEVEWEDGSTEIVRAADLVLADQRFGGRRRK